MTDTASDTSDETPFVVKEGRHFLRYWVIMTVMLFILPIGLELLNGDGIKTWRWVEIAFWTATTLFMIFFPRRTFATLDSRGVTFRKKALLDWQHINRIELARAGKFRFVMKWMWGTDEVLRFMPDDAASRLPNNWLEKASVNRFGSIYNLPAFTTGPSLQEIVQASKRFSDVPIVDERNE